MYEKYVGMCDLVGVSYVRVSESEGERENTSEREGGISGVGDRDSDCVRVECSRCRCLLVGVALVTERGYWCE